MALDWQILLACALALPAIASIVWWSLALRAIHKTESELGSAEDGLFLPQNPAPPPILVIVPAHNEQATIATLISSLRGQDYPDFRVALALDRCTDATLSIALETIAGDERFEIVEVSNCPPDWTGKVHAIHSAASRRPLAPDELVVFADADTAFHKSCLRSCAALLEDRKLDAISLLSTLTYDRMFEKITQAPAAFELLVRYPPRKASRDVRRRPFANGQFILMRSAAYEKIGTHAAFHDELLEDLAIARALWREKLRIHVLRAGRMLSCRMYSSSDAFLRGWRRIFIESAKRKPRRLKAWALGAIVRGTLSPFFSVALIGLGIAGGMLLQGRDRALSIGIAIIAAGALFVWSAAISTCLRQAGMRGALSRMFAQALWPIGCLRLARILREGAKELQTGIPTGWAGKTYSRPPR